jgi:hypothetical protein
VVVGRQGGGARKVSSECGENTWPLDELEQLSPSLRYMLIIATL